MISERYIPIAVALLAGLLFFPALGARDLWAPVEPRYGEIIRVMYLRSEWIVPSVNGGIYTDKPILYFWMALVAAKLWGGVNEWVVRLPAALGATGFVLTTYFIGRDFFSARVGALGALVLATSYRVIWEGRWAHLDTLFCCFFALTVFFGARALFQRGKPHEVLWAYVFMALATLTKGLIGVVLPALLLIASVTARRDGSLLRRMRLPLGVPLFLLLAAPWFYLVTRATEGKWLADFIYIHHFQRFTSARGHQQPFYYYLTTLPADFLPWTIFLIPAVVRYRQRWRKPETLFLVLWFAVVFVFFSFSNTKRDLYLLPLFPALALLTACYLDDLAAADWTRRRVSFWMAAGFFALLSFMGFAAPVATWLIRPDALAALLPLACVAAASGLLIAALIVCRQVMAASFSIAMMMLALTAGAASATFPYLERFKSHRSFSAEINRLVPRSAALYVYEDHSHDFNYYTAREVIPVLEGADQVARLQAGKEKSYLLIKQRALRKSPEIKADRAIAQTKLGGDTVWYLLALGP